MIHYLEGADPSIVDEETGQPIPQDELLVSVYARSNNEEVKNAANIRLFFFSLLMLSPPVILEKTVLHLFHNCLNRINLPDPRNQYIARNVLSH